MNGLELSRLYFFETALPSLRERFGAACDRMAAGLAGNGSECFGFDDEISRDHDWGEDFFIWVTEPDRSMLKELSQWKAELFETSPPPHPKARSQWGAYTEPSTVGDFYKSLTGCPGVPATVVQWRAAPEENLAMAVNGEVFMDGPGEFSAIRRGLLGHYPGDWRLKRLAAACMAMAQTGQYNLERCRRRGDVVAELAAVSRFQEAAIKAVFLLDKEFKPYYKWAWRKLCTLSPTGKEVGKLLERMALSRPDAVDLAEQICLVIGDRLIADGLSRPGDTFFTHHALELMGRIKDEQLRRLPPQFE